MQEHFFRQFSGTADDFLQFCTLMFEVNAECVLVHIDTCDCCLYCNKTNNSNIFGGKTNNLACT